MELWRRNLYILTGSVFLIFGAMTSVMPFLPLHIEQNMGLKSQDEITMWAGFIFAANFLSAFIFSPIWGKLADKYGRKMMVIRSGFGMAIVTSLMGLATNVYQLFFLRLLNGVVAGFNPAAIALVASNTPKEKIGYALGILQSGAVAGSIIGPLLGGFFADYVGFRKIFLYTGIFILIAGFVVLFLVKEDFKPDTSSEKRSMAGDFSVIAQTKPLMALFSVAFLIQFAALNITPVLPLFIQDLNPPLGMVSFFSGLVAATTGFANMLASPKLGKLGDKIGHEKILFYSIMGAALFFLPQGLSPNVWVLMGWRFMLGLTLGGLLPSVNSLIRLFAPEGMVSRTYGYSNSAIFLGNMMGPISGGFLAGIVGLHGVFIFTSLLLLVNGLWVRASVNKQIAALRSQGVI